MPGSRELGSPNSWPDGGQNGDAKLVGFRNSTPRCELKTLEFACEESFFVVATLNRPPANAISEQLVTELNAALASVESDDATRSRPRLSIT